MNENLCMNEVPVGAATQGHAARLTAGEPAPTATTNTASHVVAGLSSFLINVWPHCLGEHTVLLGAGDWWLGSHKKANHGHQVSHQVKQEGKWSSRQTRRHTSQRIT
jgi:hypothetical protein